MTAIECSGFTTAQRDLVSKDLDQLDIREKDAILDTLDGFCQSQGWEKFLWNLDCLVDDVRRRAGNPGALFRRMMYDNDFPDRTTGAEFRPKPEKDPPYQEPYKSDGYHRDPKAPTPSLSAMLEHLKKTGEIKMLFIDPDA
jgi:hypothetical protein